MNTKTNIYIFVISIFIMCGCREDPSNFSIKGNQFESSYFGFSLTVPDGWIIVDRAVTEKAFKNQAKTVAWSHDVSEDMLANSTDGIHPLLYIYKNTSDLNRSSVSIGALQIPPGTGETPCKGLLTQLLGIMEQGKIPFTSPGGISSHVIGDQPFFRTDVQVSMQGAEFFQAYISGKVRGYALLMVYTEYSKQGLDKLVDEIEGVISF